MRLYSKHLVELLTLLLRHNSFKYFLFNFACVLRIGTGCWIDCLALETQQHLLLGLTI